ncbi:tRNA sulfurtransferase [Candidatus Nanosalina sp. VS9-1]|uniref:tRNA sulfurtransferase n=1 Tax=Candidatus Nanosalina sp. VS9-1 TaxID=3388566 RepID=UPI0039E03145
MDHILVRYGDIGTKSASVRGRMVKILRQRIEDRLEYEDEEYDSVTDIPGRLIVKNARPEASEAVAELPGVASASPVKELESEIEALKNAAEDVEIGESFGIDTNRSGSHDFSSMDVNREVGTFVQDFSGAEVDLDDPETWIKFDVRDEKAFMYTETFEGPSGMPVGAADPLAALISGGIDSPVAAYEVMKRGSDITPVYFYNRPIAAEDHLMRFKASVEKLKRFHPSKDWEAYIVDMKEVNEELMDIGRGRMLLHRYIMFGIAEKIAEQENLQGIVTGEALSQKSSQTSSNMRNTSSATDFPIHRPLLTRGKAEITEKARELGTFEEASIDSACRTMAPESPATRMSNGDFEKLKRRIDVDELVEKALENTRKEEI